eukprot:777491-Pelagomonas_calceolata.AAC.1
MEDSTRVRPSWAARSIRAYSSHPSSAEAATGPSTCAPPAREAAACACAHQCPTTKHANEQAEALEDMTVATNL